LRRLALVALAVPLALAVLGTAPVGPAAGDDLADAIARQKRLETQLRAQRAQIAELDREQATLKSGIAATKASLAEVNADIAAVEGQVADLEGQVVVVEVRLQGLDVEILNLDVELAFLGVRQDVTAAELAARKAILAERIRNAYDADRTPLLAALLSSDSFTDALAEVSYHLDVAAQDRVIAEAIVRDRETLATLRATVDLTRDQAHQLRLAATEQKAALADRIVELEAARAELDRLKAETKALLAEQQVQFAALAAQEDRLEDAIAETQRAQDRLKDEIERLIRLKAQQGAIPSEYNGSLEWPLAGRITQEFGCTGFSWEPPLGACRHFHRGIDIAAPLYRPIRAAGDGVVLLAGPNPYERGTRRSWIVVIAHSSRLVTWYGHLDNREHPPAVKVGDRVSTGQVIGYVGLTGRTTGPHLHWAVQFDGRFVNPRLFL